MMHMTKYMEKTLEQVCSGLRYVDVRSGAALYRRGLATPVRLEGGGIRYHCYEPTDKGRAYYARKQAAELVRQYQRESGTTMTLHTHATVVGFAVWLAERDRLAQREKQA